MRVLIVEDDENRMVGFREWFKDDKVFWAKTAEAGIEALGFDEFDLVMLDHDLADEHYANLEVTAEDVAAFTLEGTGKDVAMYMATMDNPPPYAFVHSWNPIGARLMESILQDAGIPAFRAPYGSKELRSGLEQYKEQFEA